MEAVGFWALGVRTPGVAKSKGLLGLWFCADFQRLLAGMTKCGGFGANGVLGFGFGLRWSAGLELHGGSNLAPRSVQVARVQALYSSHIYIYI